MSDSNKPVIITEPKKYADAANASSETPSGAVSGTPVTKKKATKKPSANWFVAAVAMLLIGGTAGYGGAYLQNEMQSSATPTVLTSSEEDGNATVTANEESIAAVAKAVSPSIVSIITTTERTSRFYNQSYQQGGAGTGMIVSSDGYIMTNKHVVDGASDVSVVMQSGDTFENVEVVGVDPLNDVAFLKIKNVTDLPAVTLGDSKTIRIGQGVVAIGNALGQYQNTVTSGIVSGTGRPVVASSGGVSGDSAESLTDLIQTDAAINSGNSGGPLLNLKGQVIGINTAVSTEGQGIGFAIPIGATKGMLQNLVETGKVERPYLGVQYVSINAQVREEYDLTVNRGDYITATSGRSVQSGGPAAKAGIRDGDIITAVNGFKVGEIASVASLVSEYQPGDKVEVTLLRDGKERTISVTLGTYQQ